jgi:hypothetical protein
MIDQKAIERLKDGIDRWLLLDGEDKKALSQRIDQWAKEENEREVKGENHV